MLNADMSFERVHAVIQDERACRYERPCRIAENEGLATGSVKLSSSVPGAYFSFPSY